MAWLPGWSKRYKITIDKNKIDEDLTDFPVYIVLSSGAGLNNFNAKDIFDELTPMPSGAAFFDDFTTSGIQWSLESGGVDYSNQTAVLSGSNSVLFTTSDINFGVGHETVFRFKYTSRASSSCVARVFICYTENMEYQIMFEYFTVSSPGYFRIYKKIGSSETIVFNDAALYHYYNTYNNWFWVKMRREGDRALFKWWLATQSEPYGWLVDLPSVFSPEFPVIGKIRLYCNAPSLEFDDVLVRTFPVFSEKKIAITTSDGVTQLPVEIGYWDRYYHSGQNSQTTVLAHLWTRIPTVASGEDTVFYLYYDKNQYDNVNYVDYSGSSVSAAVWDSGFKFVGHMSINASRGYLKDSTSNNVDQVSFGVDIDDSVYSRLRTWYSFDRSTADVIVYSPNNAVTNISGALTVEVMACLVEGHGTYQCGIAHKGTDFYSSRKSWSLGFLGTGPFSVRAELSDTGGPVSSYNCYSSAVYDLNTTYYVVLRYIPGIETLIKMNNEIAAINTVSVPNSLFVSSSPNAYDRFRIGCVYNAESTYSFNGLLSELRISSVARTEAWLKATYYANMDQLLLYEAQVAPKYYYQGYVKEKGNPVQRLVRLYRQDTGALMSETTSSSGTGYYYLTTTFSGSHFIVVFDDDGAKYNALVLDRLAPTGIE